MIKNLKTRILVLLLACTVALFGGVSFSPMLAVSAQETIVYDTVYEFEKDGKSYEVTFTEDGKCTLHVDGEYIDATYTISESGKVYLSTVAEFLGAYEISGSKLIAADIGLGSSNAETSTDNLTESTETSEENAEISSDNKTDEETPVAPETPENGENTDGKDENPETDKLTKEEVAGFVKEAYESAKAWLANTYAWIIGIGGGGLLTLLLSIFWKLISRKINRTNNLTEEKIEEICERTTKKVVAGVVGKSLNVDIQSEVSAAVKAELAPMIRNAQVAMESAKNAEVGTAMVMKAQAKSRLISEEETEEMENRAASLLAHAEKYGGLSVPIQINTALNEEPKEREKVTLVEEVAKPKEKKENECFISFD